MNRSTKFFPIRPSSYVCWNGWHIFSLKYASVSYLLTTFYALRWYVWSSLSFVFLDGFFGWFSAFPLAAPHQCRKCIAYRLFIRSLHKCIRVCVHTHFIQRKICASFPVDLVLLRVHPISFPCHPSFFLHIHYMWVLACIKCIIYFSERIFVVRQCDKW